MFARLVAYVRGIARRRRISAEVDDELRFHMEQEIEAHVARGVSRAKRDEWRCAILVASTQTTEAVRDVRTIWLDLALARHPPCRAFAASDAGVHDRGACGPDAQHRRDDGDLFGGRRRHPARTAVR